MFKVRKFELSAAGAKRVVCKCIRVTIPEAKPAEGRPWPSDDDDDEHFPYSRD